MCLNVVEGILVARPIIHLLFCRTVDCRGDDCKLWTLDFKLFLTVDFELWTLQCVKFGLLNVDCGLRIMDLNCGVWTLNCGLPSSDCGLCTVDCEIWTLDCRHWLLTVDLGLWPVDCGHRLWIVKRALWTVDLAYENLKYSSSKRNSSRVSTIVNCI